MAGLRDIGSSGPNPRPKSGSGLIGRFGYLLATQAVQVIFGLGYWMVTTRLVPTSQVGLAAAGISVATLISAVGVLGIGSLLLAEMGVVAPTRVRLVLTTGIVVGTFCSGVIALGCWLLARWLGPSVHALSRNPVDMTLFVIGACAQTAGTVFDCAAIGLRNGPAQLARNALQASVRFLAVLVLALAGMRSSSVLLAAWAVSIVTSFAIAPRVLHIERAERSSRPVSQRLALVREYAGIALRHHVLNLAITSVTYFLPVIAALLVAPSALAYFALAQLISSTVLLPPALLAMSLFAEATGGDEWELARHIRRTLPIGFGCVALVLVIFEPGAGLALSLFSHRYATHGATVLRILLFGGLPYVIKDHYVAIRRAQRRLTSASRVVALATVGEAAGAAIGGACGGLTGLSAGWLAACVVSATVFAPTVLATARTRIREAT